MVIDVVGAECVVEGMVSGVRDSPCVTLCPYSTKFTSSTMTRSSQLYLTKLSEGLVDFRFSSLVPSMLEAM